MAHLAIALGIRPDVIRVSLVLNALRNQRKHRITCIWSGQHYSDNLKDIFFRELGVSGTSDAEIAGAMITACVAA